MSLRQEDAAGVAVIWESMPGEARTHENRTEDPELACHLWGALQWRSTIKSRRYSGLQEAGAQISGACAHRHAVDALEKETPACKFCDFEPSLQAGAKLTLDILNLSRRRECC